MTELISEESKGVFVIMATPFTDDGALDLQSADRLIEFYLEEGVHGLTVLGVMGEAPKLSLEEQLEFTRHVLKRIDGRVPVIVGVSNPGMDNLETLSRSTMDQGAGGVMIAGIPGLKTDEQVEGYFKAVGDRLGEDIPICLQDYPPTTTVFISVGVVNRLIAALPQLKMFKHEDCPGHRKLTLLRQAPQTEGTRRVSILTGNNGLYVPQELARGADGIMTGFAFPGMLVEVYRLFEGGRGRGSGGPVRSLPSDPAPRAAVRNGARAEKGDVAAPGGHRIGQGPRPGPENGCRGSCGNGRPPRTPQDEADFRRAPASRRSLAPLDAMPADCRMAHCGYTRQDPQQLIVFVECIGVPNGIRTRVATLKGWCPRPG